MIKDGKTIRPSAPAGGAPIDRTRPTAPMREERTQPNPQSVPEGGTSVFPALDAHAGGPAKGSPATIGKPGGGGKSFRVGGG
jgi:hypothetical protein